MPRARIVASQPVPPDKAELATCLRKAMTSAEKALWAGLRGKQLGGTRFRRQQVMRGFIVDFYRPAAGLVIEVDGPIHDELTESDAARDLIFREAGPRVIHVTNADVLTNLPSVLQRIQQAPSDG